MGFEMLFPMPASIEAWPGVFELDKETAVIGTGKAASLLRSDIKRFLSIEPRGGIAAKKAVTLINAKGRRYSDESYVVEIAEGAVTITGSKRGVFWGAQTLRQLIRTTGGKLPCGVITDRPLLGTRGIMLDCTRGKVFTLKTLKHIADIAALYKINQLQIYVENCVDFPFAKELWENSTPLTAADIRLFDRYCAALCIELVPCFATFGHLYNLLETKAYRHLRELDAGDPEKGYWIKKMCHHTLDVTNPESYELVKKIIDYAAPLFRTDKFNICCDETFDLGKGKAAALVAEKGVGKVYVDFLNFVIRYTRTYKKEIQIWGDIILEHAELIDEIEPNCVFLNWEYSKNVNPEKTAVFAKAGVRQFSCPGTSGWNNCVNNLNSAFTNISKMAAYAARYKSEGLLNTDWGDYGHINPVASSIPAFIYGAGASWASLSEDTAEYDEKISVLEYGCPGVVSAIKKATASSVANWGHLVCWYYLTRGEVEPFAQEKIEKKIEEKLALPQSTVKNAIKEAKEAYIELAALKKKVVPEKRAEIDEILTGIKGEIVIRKWVLALKKLSGKPAVIDLNYYANEIERFSKELSLRWRKAYKESELWRLQTVLSRLAEMMRAGEVKK